MRAISSQEPALTIVHLASSLDSTGLHTLAWIDDELDIAMAETPEAKYLVLDLTDVPYIGAAFLSLLVRLIKRLRKRQCRLVVAASGFGAEVIRITNLDHLIVTLSSLEAAMHWCRTGEFHVGNTDNSRVPSRLARQARASWASSPRCNREKASTELSDTIFLCRLTIRSQTRYLPLASVEDAEQVAASSRSASSVISN